jgi:hypothetical protein
VKHNVLNYIVTANLLEVKNSSGWKTVYKISFESLILIFKFFREIFLTVCDSVNVGTCKCHVFSRVDLDRIYNYLVTPV